MFRQDYIIRMIQEFGQILLGVRDLIRGLRYTEALDRLDESCQQLAGLDIDGVASRPLAELLARLTFGDEPDVARDKCVACAAALQAAGAAYAGLGRAQDSSACYLQALNLTLEVHLQNEHASLPDYAPTPEELVVQLNAYTLPPRTNATLLRYYEQDASYGKAEDALFAMLDVEPENAAARDLGQAFYERLLQLSDAALEAGNLPRAEVEAGLVELGRL